MSVAAVILSSVLDERRPKGGPSRGGAAQILARLAAAAGAASGFADVVVVLGHEGQVALPAGATVLLDGAEEPSEASALRAAIDYCQRLGHDVVVVAYGGGDAERWREHEADWQTLAGRRAPVSVGTRRGQPVGIVALRAEAWPLLPLAGELATLWRQHPELVERIELTGEPTDMASERPRGDRVLVEELLGRPVSAPFEVVVRDGAGTPVVIANAPFLHDGTPMPTSYWLVGRREREAVGRLEAAGGVRRAQEAVPAEEVSAAHDRYAAEREKRIPAGHVGPRPSGGVGGTAVGVKCLHAHLAWYLAGGRDPVGRWVVTQLAGEIEGPLAAIDCGTNSTRLLVVDRGGKTLSRKMTITRLGAGVDRTGDLDTEAIERTLAALRTYRAEMDAHGVVAARATATSAARDARNADALFAPAEAILGFRPELLDGDEEGALAYRGATAELDPADGPYLVVDVGGGSTELVAGEADGIVVRSLDVGCVRLTERFFHHDPPEPTELASAGEHVAALLAKARDEPTELASAPRMVGLAGTVTTLAALDLGLDGYERDRLHHAVLQRLRVEQLLDELAAVSASDRAQRPPIEVGRADVIVGGALVLAEVMAAFGHDELIVSEADILDGLVASLRAE